MKILYPLRGVYRVSDSFGPRRSFQLPDGRWTLPFHYGVDFSAPQGTPVYASHSGTVTFAGWDSSGYGGGYQVQVTDGRWSTWYLHMVERPLVRVGQRVSSGTVLGRVGSTGASTGPHLHLELHENGVPVDPAKFLSYNGSDYVSPVVAESDEEEMRLWIADVGGKWYLVVPTGSGKPNASVLPGNSGMGGGGAARAGIPVIKFSSASALKKVANI